MPRKKPQPSGRWLSDDEIREMADSSQRDVQIQYLRERGVPFTLSRLGRPLVLVSEIEGRSQPKIMDPMLEAFNGVAPIVWLHERMHMYSMKPAEIILRSIFDDQKTDLSFSGVYFLIKNHEIMYVGKSQQIDTRLIQHKRDGKKFDRVFCIELPSIVMGMVEGVYIHALNPPWNNDMPILYHNMQQYVSACSPERPEVTQ